MEYLSKEDPVYELIIPAVEGLGFGVVELNSRVVQRQLHVALVVFRPEGVSINDCAEIYRTVQPRLEMAEGERDVHLEVSSPGLSRKMKSADEMRIFKGRGVQYLLEGEDDWNSGILGTAGPETVEITVNEEVRLVPIGKIRKMKLDDTQEFRR